MLFFPFAAIAYILLTWELHWVIKLALAIAGYFLLFIAPAINYRVSRKSLMRRAKHLIWFSVNPDKLEIGDIIAVRDEGRTSRTIQKETGGRFSHVALYVGSNTITEGVFPRARVLAANSYVFTTDKNSFCVLRLKDKRELDTRTLADEAGYYSYNLYSLGKAFNFKYRLFGRVGAKDAHICSELVALAYRRSGVPLCERGLESRISPADICRSRLLKNVTRDCIIPWGHGKSAAAFTDVLNKSSALTTSRTIWRRMWSLVYAISPLRSGWAKPMNRWKGIEFFAYLYTAAPLLLNCVICVIQYLNFGFTRLMRRQIAKDPKFAAMLIRLNTERIEGTRVALTQDLMGLEYFNEFPHRWRVRFAKLDRVSVRLKNREIAILEKIARLYTNTKTTES
jgi:hypothetical protein